MTDAEPRESAEARIRERIRRGGRLTFADFMAEALYGPAGYYTTHARLGGAGADFFTSPELHPVFGALLGRFAASIWAALDRPASFDVVEHGPGSAALCRDLLTWAAHDHPDFAAAIRYRLVETSPTLRTVQQRSLDSAGLLDRVSWSDALDPGRRLSPASEWGPVRTWSRPRPTAPGEGLIIANELVDALPVHVVVVRDGRLLERYVVLDGDRLAWAEDEPSTPVLAAYFARLGLLPGEGCVAEVNLAGVAWMEHAAATLDRGALLLVDYGYPAAELYAPHRRYGTLLTYHAHTLGSDPFVRVGEQDLTSHLDFTSLARAGERAGLATVGLLDQATFLTRLGLPEYLRRLDASPVSAGVHDENRRAILALVDPTGLGRVQALLQTRDLPGFAPLDLAGVPPPARLPLLRPGQMRLPGPLEVEGPIDLDAQWRELFGEAEADQAP